MQLSAWRLWAPLSREEFDDSFGFIPVLCVLVTCTSTQTCFHPWDSRYLVASINSAFASYVTICTRVRVNIASSGSKGDVVFGIKSKILEGIRFICCLNICCMRFLKGHFPDMLLANYIKCWLVVT